MVTRLIVDGKLAPFYRGFEDWEEDYGEQDIARVLAEVREKDYAEGVGNSVTEAMKLEREGGGGMGSMAKKIGMHRSRQNRLEEEKEERDRRERKAYIGATECPICFLVRRVHVRADDSIILPTSTRLAAANSRSVRSASSR